MTDKKVSMLISPSNRKPYCVLLQAAYGIPYDPMLLHEFDDWQVDLADDAVLMAGTHEQWRALAKRWNAAK